MKAAKTRALSRKHAGTGKHQGTGKHSPSAQKKAATGHAQVARRTVKQVKAAHVRALGDVACCCAEAVAASARLAGHAVSDSAVLALHGYAGGSGSAALTIEAALTAACEAGVAGVRPVGWARWSAFETDCPAALSAPGAPRQQLSIILGLDLPEAPHAVTLDPSGAVWSWGGLYEMTAEAVVEEAWAVVWP